MSGPSVDAVLWDADGVLQHTPPEVWGLATTVVAQFPGALRGAPIDEASIRRAADAVGLGDRIDDVLSVWWTFDVLAPSLATVAQVRAAGTRCYLATNQDAYRAACMRDKAPYDDLLDGAYYSCDVGVAKPDPAFFVHIATDLGIAPERLLFLDDQPANVDGARRAGLNAECWTHSEGLPRLLDVFERYGVGADRAL
ncbi:HAD-IA family hydrolase [Microbacterium kyungheense]|uniref:Putative hydrolase of the HAD superfamily n=1 Tax=Microbacterium kyungheense TaxID=1263636 RepID=A0A543EF86_9MICO|nr:HAD-IA family hydrolase [Microbacterium kyungheense]TQM20169.1 putative hydrolase of the HAD superfamily [Microbacterium kyungheense]